MYENINKRISHSNIHHFTIVTQFIRVDKILAVWFDSHKNLVSQQDPTEHKASIISTRMHQTHVQGFPSLLRTLDWWIGAGDPLPQDQPKFIRGPQSSDNSHHMLAAAAVLHFFMRLGYVLASVLLFATWSYFVISLVNLDDIQPPLNSLLGMNFNIVGRNSQLVVCGLGGSAPKFITSSSKEKSYFKWGMSRNEI